MGLQKLGSGISLSKERYDKTTPPGQITAAKLRKEVALTQSHVLQIFTRACLDDGIQPRLAGQGKQLCTSQKSEEDLGPTSGLFHS